MLFKYVVLSPAIESEYPISASSANATEEKTAEKDMVKAMHSVKIRFNLPFLLLFPNRSMDCLSIHFRLTLLFLSHHNKDKTLRLHIELMN